MYSDYTDIQLLLTLYMYAYSDYCNQQTCLLQEHELDLIK